MGNQSGPDDRDVVVELADLGRAGNGAGVDLEAHRVVSRPSALDVKTRVGGDNMQSGRRDGGIVVEEEIALERRLSREHGADDWGRHPFDARIEVDDEPPSSTLPRDDDVAARPDVRPCREIELGVEIVEHAGAVEGELHRAGPGDWRDGRRRRPRAPRN